MKDLQGAAVFADWEGDRFLVCTYPQKYWLERIHKDCHKLIKQSLGKDLPVAGNIGVFCQSQEEYKKLKQLSVTLTKPSDNPDQKYYLLKKPIVIIPSGNVPKAVYTYLYIRKPDPSTFGQYLGDIDFVMELAEYERFKEAVVSGQLKGAGVYNRMSWDIVQITSPDIDSVALVSTRDFAEKVRVRFD